MRRSLLVSLMAAGLMVVALSATVACRGKVTNPEIDQARKATEQYKKAELSVATGTVGPYKALKNPDGTLNRLPGIGYRYRVDPPFPETFNPATPQVLFYDDAGSGRRLVGVAYLVKSGESPPEGFTGPDDVWSTTIPTTPPTQLPPGVWRLHAWIWEGNPDGIFNTTNTNIP